MLSYSESLLQGTMLNTVWIFKEGFLFLEAYNSVKELSLFITVIYLLNAMFMAKSIVGI